ncbi:MAG: HyaD/HybD family hydrogenase maturation endopeptidase [bacterium]
MLGIGNLLLTDEGIGVHVVRQLNDQPSAGIHYLDGGTLSFTLAADIAEADNLIVVDATELKADPGTVKVFINEEMDDFLGNAKRSVHEVGLLDLLDISRLTDDLPSNRALIGIQPKSLDWGESPSPEVEASLEEAVSRTRELLANWHKQPSDATSEVRTS